MQQEEWVSTRLVLKVSDTRFHLVLENIYQRRFLNLFTQSCEVLLRLRPMEVLIVFSKVKIVNVGYMQGVDDYG